MFLSLLGITIGIFSVISVLTVFDSMKISIEKSISKLGSETIYIGKFPWKNDENTNWRKLSQRPNLRYRDMLELQKRNTTFEAIGIFVQKFGKIKHLEKNLEGAAIIGASHDYSKILALEIEKGRYFSENESHSGAKVVVVGNQVATKLLGKNPIGKQIQYKGKKMSVIGVLAPSGNDFGGGNDQSILMPIQFMRQFMNLRNEGSAQIVVQPKATVEMEKVKDEIRLLMRSIHRLKPKAEDDFAINEMSIITEQFYSFFKILNIVGWIIGGFSLLVGGFGIANIMFVSVKERTKEIGIQMAMGAKRFFILFQFLFEAIFLALFGGVIGLILIFILISVANMIIPFELILTFQNILFGILVSVAIGLFSGLAPAYLASKMDPVDAMRSV